MYSPPILKEFEDHFSIVITNPFGLCSANLDEWREYVKILCDENRLVIAYHQKAWGATFYFKHEPDLTHFKLKWL